MVLFLIALICCLVLLGCFKQVGLNVPVVMLIKKSVVKNKEKKVLCTSLHIFILQSQNVCMYFIFDMKL